MNLNEILDWGIRILGGLAALLALGVFVILLGKLGDIFSWLGKTVWGLIRWIGLLLRSPRQTLLASVEHSTLLAFAIFPFTWLYEKLWLRPKLKRLGPRPGLAKAQVVDRPTDCVPPRPIPAALADLMRQWQADDFDLQPIADLPGSQVYPLSVFMHEELAGAAPGAYAVEPARPREDGRLRWRVAMWRGPGNNDVPEGELTALRDLLDLGMPSFERRHVLGLEFDEAEFFAWWTQHHFNAASEMNLPGWLRVSELTIAYCEAHRYPIWRFAHENPREEDRRHWREGLIAVLAAYHEAVLYARFMASDTRSSARACLWREEVAGRYRPLSSPSRNWTTFKLTKTPEEWNVIMNGWIKETQPIRLIDLLQTEAGVDALVNRLEPKLMPAYTRKDLAQSGVDWPRWVWADVGTDPVCLLLGKDEHETARIRFPSCWTANPSWGGYGLLHFKHGRLKVTNAEGLSGLIDMDGRFTVPCQHAYLDERLGDGNAYEVADRLVLDSRGEVLCDLIDGDGQRINPPGLKVLASTLHANGCVVTTENSDGPLRLDWMDASGSIRDGVKIVPANGLRWLSVWDASERRRPVQSPENGLWGYLDETGTVAIQPQFKAVGSFRQGIALASNSPDKFGLIDPMGNWLLPPRWANIWPESRQCHVVEDDLGRIGAINPQGKIIVPLRQRSEILAEQTESANASWQEENLLVDAVMRQWRRALKIRVDAAIQAGSLATLEGLFDPDASQSDLQQTGLWYLRVSVTQDQIKGILQPKAGETGHIFTQYPVSLSTFDLSVEAPVAGLAAKPDAIIGVPWKDLAPD